MKFNLILILGLIIYSSPVLANGKPFNTHIQINLAEYGRDIDSLEVEVQLFNSFLGTYYQIYKSFLVPAANIGIDFSLPEISTGIINIKENGKVVSSSGSIIFNGDTLIGRPGTPKESLIVRGGENEFMQNNFMLPFILPSIISNHPSFKQKMVQRAYDLQIPEDPMLQAIYMEYLRNVISLVRQYPNSFHILNRLYDRASNITLKTLDTALTIFSERILKTVPGRNLKIYVANGKWLLNKPDLNTVPLVSVSEKELSLGSIIDSTKHTFIDFWASWCVPCRAFNTSLAQKYSDLDTNAIQIISISLDEDTNKWKKALTKDQLPWLNIIDPSFKGFNGDLAQLFNIQFIPQSFLFDKKGNIVQMNLSIEELMKIGKE